jgi:hypothetical protein
LEKSIVTNSKGYCKSNFVTEDQPTSQTRLGGTRVIENLLSVMRELGLVTIFRDGNFSSVQTLFDATGTLLDPAYRKRIDKFGIVNLMDHSLTRRQHIVIMIFLDTLCCIISHLVILKLTMPRTRMVIAYMSSLTTSCTQKSHDIAHSLIEQKSHNIAH